MQNHFFEIDPKSVWLFIFMGITGIWNNITPGGAVLALNGIAAALAILYHIIKIRQATKNKNNE